MDTKDTYEIDLLSPKLEGATFEYEIDDEFFACVDGLVRSGRVRTEVTCVGVGAIIKFRIHSAGVVVVPCDRCLSALEVQIDTSDELNVKLGDEYADEGDYVLVPATEGRLDLAQFIYEFIALSMPISCCHEPGGCDDTMMRELDKHSRVCDEEMAEEDGDEAPGNSWQAALKQLKDKM